MSTYKLIFLGVTPPFYKFNVCEFPVPNINLFYPPPVCMINISSEELVPVVRSSVILIESLKQKLNFTTFDQEHMFPCLQCTFSLLIGHKINQSLYTVFIFAKFKMAPTRMWQTLAVFLTFCVILYAKDIPKPIKLSEDSWEDMLEGEWLVKL